MHGIPSHNTTASCSSTSLDQTGQGAPLVFRQAVNTKRFERLLALTHDDLWLAHILDRLVYRCQNSRNVYFRHQPYCFTEPLEALRQFVGATSIRTLQNALDKLAKLGWIARRATPATAGKQCHIWLTEALLAALPPLSHAANSPTFYQAENIDRFDALARLCPGQGKRALLLVFLLDRCIYRTQNSNRIDTDGDRYFVCALEKLAACCHMSVSTLQRHLKQLVRLKLLIKTKVRLSDYRVETRYSIPQTVWAALRAADDSTAQRSALHQQQVALDRANASATLLPEGCSLQPDEIVDPSRHEMDDHNSNKDYINIFFDYLWVYIFIYNNTARVREKAPPQPTSNHPSYTTSIVTLKPMVHSSSASSDASISPLSPPITSSTAFSHKGKGPSPINRPLTRRETRYIDGMLTKLMSQHGVLISDPAGLKQEIYFAVRSAYFFSDKPCFHHRVNIVAKLLRQKRWTTPFGYEKYDPAGQAQRDRRLVRERAWAKQKTEERDWCQPTVVDVGPKASGGGRACHHDTAYRGQRVVNLTSEERSTDAPSRLDRKLRETVSAQVGDLQAQIQSLHAEMRLPTCSPVKQDLLSECIVRHQSRIQTIQSLSTLPADEALRQLCG